MNNDGRKRIDAIIRDIEKMAALRSEIDNLIEQVNERYAEYRDKFGDIATAIEELKDEEGEKFDNLSEGLQQSERGQSIEAAVSQLETAYDAASGAADIEDIEFSFDADEIITALDEAKYS